MEKKRYLEIMETVYSSFDKDFSERQTSAWWRRFKDTDEAVFIAGIENLALNGSSIILKWVLQGIKEYEGWRMQ